MEDCKIKIKLVKFDGALVMQILAQDRRFISSPDMPAVFEASNGLIVSSKGFPELGDNEISLRGNEFSRNFRISTRKFISDEWRDIYLERLLDALNEWAANWKGFKVAVDSSIKDGVHII